MSAANILEEMLYKFLSRQLTDAEKKSLYCGWDAEKHIDEETEEELKEQVYLFVKSQVLWARILVRLRDEAGDDEEEEEDQEDDSSVEYD